MASLRVTIGLGFVLLSACGDAVPEDHASTASALAAGTVIGVVDGVFGDHLVGWACETGNPNPLAVHLYLDGPAGAGSIYGGYVADAPNEQAVDDACQTTGNHRFAIPIDAALHRHPYRPMFVHGISVSGGPNNLLAGSGEHRVPAVPFVKHGNNGAATCNEFCAGRQWGTAGSCVGVALTGFPCTQPMGLVRAPLEESCTCADGAGTFAKSGDNGTADCATFCAGAQWGRVGSCVDAQLAPDATLDVDGTNVPYAADCGIAPGPIANGAEMTCLCMPGDEADGAGMATVATGGTNSVAELSMHDLAVPENSALYRARGGQLYIHEVGWLNTSEADRRTIASLFPDPPIFETGGPQAPGTMSEIVPYWPAASVVCVDTSAWPLPDAMPADYAATIKRAWGEHAGAVGVYYSPNDGKTFQRPFADPAFDGLRAALRTAGALCTDAPPYFYLAMPDAYRAWTADSIRWARGAGITVVSALYPGSSTDEWADAEATVTDLLHRGAIPTTWAINGYYGTPTGQSVLHPIGNENIGADSMFTALHLLVGHGAQPRP